MTKKEFIEELTDILELEDTNVDFDTQIALDSLSTLTVIAFLDENFGIKASSEELKLVSSINDIAKIIGIENLKLK